MRKVQSSLFDVHISSIAFVLALFVLVHISAAPAIASGKWTGVDESVVEKFAKEQGKEVREPLINTNQGDLLLFIFLASGAIAGFAAGYYWRKLTEPRKPGSKHEQQER